MEKSGAFARVNVVTLREEWQGRQRGQGNTTTLRERVRASAQRECEGGLEGVYSRLRVCFGEAHMSAGQPGKLTVSEAL